VVPPSTTHHSLLTTHHLIYAAGLRLEEATHLAVRDIDSARMLLRVACGKGAKERLVPLSPRLLDELRAYWKLVRPPRWLFPGGAPDRPIAPTTVQKSCKRAAREAGIAKLVTPHVLRHSYATGLMEAGVDLLTISRLLGHRSFATTMVYLHVRRPHLERTVSPLDLLPVEQCPRFAEPGLDLSGRGPKGTGPIRHIYDYLNLSAFSGPKTDAGSQSQMSDGPAADPGLQTSAPDQPDPRDQPAPVPNLCADFVAGRRKGVRRAKKRCQEPFIRSFAFQKRKKVPDTNGTAGCGI